MRDGRNGSSIPRPKRDVPIPNGFGITTRKTVTITNSLGRRVETVYDNRGNAVWVSSEALTEYYTYDHNNNVIKLERRLKHPALRQEVAGVWEGNSETQSFGFEYTYNDAGMITEMTYPDGAVHAYEYDPALGRLEQIKAVTDVEAWRNGSSNPMYYRH